AGQSYLSPGPPQEARTLPSGSNCSTGGARRQHSERGGSCAAPSSSTGLLRGRCSTQMLSFRSTSTPATCPRIHLFGSCFGQLGSTANFGGAEPSCDALLSLQAVRGAITATSAAEPARSARFRHRLGRESK